MTLLNELNVGGQQYGMMGAVPMGTCATPAGTAIKESAFADDFELSAGNLISVTFTYANTYGDGSTTYPSLKIGLYTYPIKYSTGAYAASGAWASGQAVTFMFDGTNLLMTTLPIANEVALNNMKSVTSNAVALMFSNIRGWSFFTPDYSKYILMADITTWYNSTSASQTQNIGFMGMLMRFRAAGQQANSTCIITLSVGWYRDNLQLPDDIIANIAKTETSQYPIYSLCIISYQNKIYLAVRLNSIQAGNNYFFGYASQNPLLTVLSKNETVDELYVVA